MQTLRSFNQMVRNIKFSTCCTSHVNHPSLAHTSPGAEQLPSIFFHIVNLLNTVIYGLNAHQHITVQKLVYSVIKTFVFRVLDTCKLSYCLSLLPHTKVLCSRKLFSIQRN